MKENVAKDGGLPKPPAKTKKKRPNFAENFSEYFYDYSSNTSIQGIKYLGDRNRSMFEKLFWLICLSISIYLCAYLINQVYHKWQNSPVIVTFSNNLRPVWEVPFPAVTICPESKTNRSVYDYTYAFNKFHNEPDNMTEQELKHFEQMNFLCEDETLPNGNKVVENDTIDFIVKVAPNIDSWWCIWNHTNGEILPCKMLLTPVLTDVGVCFTFNMLNREELFTSSAYYYGNFLKQGVKSTNWTMEKGYSKDAGVDTFPRRTTAGRALSFAILLTTYEPDLDYACGGAMYGYKVLLHSPIEMPRMYRNSFMASFNKQILVSMKPEMMTTSDELESYDPNTRQCYYSHERHLKYFQVYTQSNCELECLTNHTLEQCGCVSFYMPRAATTDICGRSNALCLATAEKIMIAREMKLEIVDYDSEIQESCNCLPSCTSVTYEAETSAVEHNLKKRFEARNSHTNVSGITAAAIFFFFKVQHFITTERKELYGLTDFIANCGGFLGLFIGFSFLSIIEIIYFLTLRLFCNVKTHRLHFRPGSGTITSDKFCNSNSNTPPKNFVLPKRHLTIIDVK